MRLIQPNGRWQLTAADIEFILETLRPGLDSMQALGHLLTDPEMRDVILDDPRLLQAVLENPACVRVSSHLYFYVLVRHVFRNSALDDRRLADYVAEILAEFSHIERTRVSADTSRSAVPYFCDLLAAMQTVDDTTRFHLRVHVGNTSLFLTGIFPDHLRHRSERRGAPGLSYYEELGRANYRVAGDHRLAHHYELAELLHTLAERFQETRRALNDLGERLISLGDADCSRPLRWLGYEI